MRMLMMKKMCLGKCPYCEQYNGFTEDRDYNQLVKDQFEVKDYKTPTVCSPSEFTVARSVLCDVCSQNQVLKVRQLAAFVPFNEAAYNDEITAYKDCLERRCGLCDTCRCQVFQYLDAKKKNLASTMTDEHIQILDKLVPQKQQEIIDNQIQKISKDAVHLILWLLLVLMTSNIPALPLSRLSLTRESYLLVSAVTLVLSAACRLRPRSPRNVTSLTITKFPTAKNKGLLI